MNPKDELDKLVRDDQIIMRGEMLFFKSEVRKIIDKAVEDNRTTITNRLNKCLEYYENAGNSAFEKQFRVNLNDDFYNGVRSLAILLRDQLNNPEKYIRSTLNEKI